MSYQIVYDSLPSRNSKRVPVLSRSGLLAFVFFCALILIVFTFWEEGRNILCYLMIPGDTEKTLHSLEIFMGNLRNGSSFVNAAEAFCADVFSGIH